MDYEEGGHVRNLLSADDGDWLRYTDNVLNRLDINREVARYLYDKQWRGLVTSRTQAAEEKRWRDAMGRKSKLRKYRTVKDKLVFEPYPNFGSRRTRLRLLGGLRRHGDGLDHGHRLGRRNGLGHGRCLDGLRAGRRALGLRGRRFALTLGRLHGEIRRRWGRPAGPISQIRLPVSAFR